jgi:hypothetical protein
VSCKNRSCKCCRWDPGEDDEPTRVVGKIDSVVPIRQTAPPAVRGSEGRQILLGIAGTERREVRRQRGFFERLEFAPRRCKHKRLAGTLDRARDAGIDILRMLNGGRKEEGSGALSCVLWASAATSVRQEVRAAAWVDR